MLKLTLVMLRTIQKKKIINMLQIENVPFKVLIVDSETLEILSALLSVSDLRKCGVTVHFLVSSERSEIKDVPAVYFVSDPYLLINEMSRNLYGSYYLNVSGYFSRNAIEKIAQEASERGIANRVLSLYDQFLGYTALEEDLFTLNISESYMRKCDPEVLRKITNGLLGIFVSIGEMPYIVGGSGELGRMVYQKMNNMKRLFHKEMVDYSRYNNIESSSSIVSDGMDKSDKINTKNYRSKPIENFGISDVSKSNNIKKTLLVIIDRDLDLVTPCRHVNGYIELVNDILGIKNNKVGNIKGDNNPENKNISIDTDCEFYKENRFKDFPLVAELFEKELNEYKKEMALRSITERSDKAAIAQALESVPRLKKRGEMINTHLNICMRVVGEMRRRKLDDFFRMEEEFNRDEIQEIVASGTPTDVERLCIALLSGGDNTLVNPIMETKKIDPKIVDYISNSVTRDGGLREKFKKLLFRRTLPICNIVEEILTAIKKQSLEKFEYYDPGNNGIYFSEISHIIVFINGGATYTELKALKYIEKSYKIPVILGGSEILNAESFITQLRASELNSD